MADKGNWRETGGRREREERQERSREGGNIKWRKGGKAEGGKKRRKDKMEKESRAEVVDSKQRKCRLLQYTVLPTQVLATLLSKRNLENAGCWSAQAWRASALSLSNSTAPKQNFLWVFCLHVCLSCVSLWRSEENVGPPGTAVIDGREAPCKC